MNVLERSGRNIPDGLKGIRVLGFGVGEYVRRYSLLSPDKETERAINQIRLILPHSGLLVADSHEDAYGIVASTMAFSEELNPNRVIMPVAGYIYYSPLYKGIFEGVNQVEGLEAYPVFRAEERGKAKRKVKDYSGLTIEQKGSANRRYLRVIRGLKDSPESFSVLAPYASRRNYGGRIRSGVILALRTGVPVVFTVSQGSLWPYGGYAVRVSENIRKFSGKDSQEGIEVAVLREFERLKGNVNVE